MGPGLSGGKRGSRRISEIYVIACHKQKSENPEYEFHPIPLGGDVLAPFLSCLPA